MTRKQLAKIFNVSSSLIDDAFQEAKKEHPELEPNGKGRDVDYTLNQVYTAMAYFRNGKGLSVLEKTILEEEFTMKPKPSAKPIGVKGTEEFVERVKRYPKLHCCSTCAYCIKSTIRNNAPVLYPYCKLWNRFIHLMKADPYKDHCRQWEYSNKEPLIFYKYKSPVNVDIYGNVKNEVMGFDNSAFSSKADGTGRLVTDVGFDEDVLN